MRFSSGAWCLKAFHARVFSMFACTEDNSSATSIIVPKLVVKATPWLPSSFLGCRTVKIALPSIIFNWVWFWPNQQLIWFLFVAQVSSTGRCVSVATARSSLFFVRVCSRLRQRQKDSASGHLSHYSVFPSVIAQSQFVLATTPCIFALSSLHCVWYRSLLFLGSYLQSV